MQGVGLHVVVKDPTASLIGLATACARTNGPVRLSSTRYSMWLHAPWIWIQVDLDTTRYNILHVTTLLGLIPD